MIAGATRGAGGRALGKHLADTKRQNEVTRPGASRGLVSEDICNQVTELTDLASHARSRRPLYHMHADPAGRWTEDQWVAHWQRTEDEFALGRQPFAEVVHVKGGREHRHRVYSLVKSDGTCIRMDHDHARREKLSRIAELATGGKLTPGAHNRAVIHALDREGRGDLASELRAAGLDTMERPRATMTPGERAQQERTDVTKESVRGAALAAWREADGGQAFEAALAARGLRLALGDSTPQLVDATGGTHDLRRTLAAAAKESGGERITTAGVRGRLAGLALPDVDQARQAIADALARPAPTSQEQGNPHDDTIQHVGEAFPHQPQDPPTPDLERQRDRPAHRGGDGGREDPAGSPDTGCEGPGPGCVRGAPDRPDDPGPDGPPRPPRSATGRGEGAARPSARPADGDRGGSRTDRAAAGRTRIAARRQVRGLAHAVAARAPQLAALTAALRRPPTPVVLAQEALARDDEAIDLILAGESYADPRSRNHRVILLDMEDQVHASVSKAERHAAAASERAQEAQGRLRLRDRLVPWATPAKREAAAAVAEAERMQLAAQGERADLRDALRQADQRARGLVRARQREHAIWESRPDVAAAKKNQRLNLAIGAAVAAGDSQIIALAAVGELRIARGVIRRREAKTLRQVAERLATEHVEGMGDCEPDHKPFAVGWLRSPGLS